MTFRNKVSYMVKNISILYNYVTNFDNYVIKISINCKMTIESFLILMRVRNPKTTINNKVTATEQIFVLDPVN